jgi:hypothetical protein
VPENTACTWQISHFTTACLKSNGNMVSSWLKSGPKSSAETLSMAMLASTDSSSETSHVMLFF